VGSVDRRPLSASLALVASAPGPLEATIARAGSADYDGVELPIAPDVPDAPPLVAALQAARVTCTGGLATSTAALDPSSNDAAVRAATIAYLEQALSLVASLGGRILVVVPSAVGVPEPSCGRGAARQAAVETLRACSDRAEELSVRLVLEPLNRYEAFLVNRADEACALAEEIGGGCGVCLDLFHMNIEEDDWEAAIRASAAYLADVHVAENTRRAPGVSAYDWAALGRLLEDMRYDGFVTVEYDVATEAAAAGGRSLDEAAADAARVLRAALPSS
jgi:sugar phosphate isomerase/epimerase